MGLEELIRYAMIAVPVILIVVLFLSRNKAVKEKKAAQRNLEDTLSNLEAVYSEVNTTQEELNAKYRELKASEDKIRKLAYEDSMTGLPNQAAFQEVLQHTMETLRREENVAVLSLDLDDFKEINNLWGNACGDELILDVSHRLKQNLDEDDYLARGGSDEFFILSQNIGEPEEFEEKVRRLQKAFRFPFVLSVGEFTITISIGVVLGPRDGKTAAALMKRVGTALNQAKWLGKNTYCYYTEALEQKQLDEMEMRTELTAAMKRSDFYLRYQPVLQPQKRECSGFRVELYWDRGEKGIWRAGRFIRFAEETGQIIALGERVLRRCCKDVKAWQEAGVTGMDVIMSLSRRQFLSPSFENIVRTVCEEEGVSLDQFVFEISEKRATADYEDCQYLMKDLAGRGFRFRMGDFGSGLMSLDCVRELPLEQVAISLHRIYEEHDQEEAKQYFKVVADAVHALGRKMVVTDISDVIEEQIAMEVVGEQVQGELYGASLSTEEVAAGWQKSVYLE